MSIYTEAGATDAGLEEVGRRQAAGCERCQRGERRVHNLTNWGHRVCPHWFVACRPNNGEPKCCEKKPGDQQ